MALCQNIILDMDYGSDVDDTAALRVAESLQERGVVSLNAVMITSSDEEASKAVWGQLCKDGFPVPVGVTTRGVPSRDVYWTDFINRYFYEDDYHPRNSTELYKEILRDFKERGEKLRIVVTGFLMNIEDLLSDPEGYALVEECVDSIWVDGGAYPYSGQDYNFYWTDSTIQAIRYVNANCPVPMVFITNETASITDGGRMKVGKEVQFVVADPVNVAYCDYEHAYNEDLSNGHSAWDPITVWAAALPLKETKMELTYINAFFTSDGTNIYVPRASEEDADHPYRLILERQSDDLNWYERQLESYMILLKDL